MADPFQALVNRQRIHLATGVLFIIGLVGFLTLYGSRTYVGEARELQATVAGFGIYPHPKGIGEVPVLTVQLLDGSNRQVRASRLAVNNCVVGGKVSLVQTGSALRVSMRGCGSGS